METEKKQRKSLTIFGLIIAIALIIIGTGYVIGANDWNLNQAQVAADAPNKYSYFWNTFVGDRIVCSEDDAEYNQRQWICLSEKNLNKWYSSGELAGDDDKAKIVRAIVEVSYSNNGRYNTSVYAEDYRNVGNALTSWESRKLAYLCYAATEAGGTGLVADELKLNSARNALYNFFNTTDLTNMIGSFAQKADGSTYPESAVNGQEVTNKANHYADTESQSSSATVTASSSDGAEVKIQNGYSYVGPFTMTTEGTITTVTLTDGENGRNISGYATELGGGINTDLTQIPRNKTQFWIVTQDTLTATEVSVKINTEGAAGGGTIIDPHNGGTDETRGFIKARIIFIGNEPSQGTAIFYGEASPTEPTYGDVTFTAKNNLGRIIVSKDEKKQGDWNYDDVPNFGFKVYRLDGDQRRYLRANDLNEVRDQQIVSIGSGTSYDESEDRGTVFYTANRGLVTLDNISIEYDYYVQEVDNSGTDVKLQLTGDTEVNPILTDTNYGVYRDEGIVGPIGVDLKGEDNKATYVTLYNYSKTGDLRISKVDEDNYDKKLGNVEFLIKAKATGMYVRADQIADGRYEITNQDNAYVNSEEDATIFVTNENDGTIEVTGIDTGDYDIIEVNNPNFGYTVYPEGVTATVQDSQASDLTVPNEKQTGNLEIYKFDKDDENRSLAGVKFKIRTTDGQYVVAEDESGTVQSQVTGEIYLGDMQFTTNADNATEFITDDNGHIVVRNMLIGKYNVIETENNNYGYDISNDATIVWESNMGSGTGKVTQVEVVRKTSTETEESAGNSEEIFDKLTITNQRQTGNLEVYKVDEDNANHPIANVGFRIRNSEGQYVIAYDEDGNEQEEVTGTINLGNMQTTANEDDATIFRTDDDGYIRIFDMLIGRYTVVEIENNNFGYEINGDDSYIKWQSNMGSGDSVNTQVEVARQSSTDTTDNTTYNQNIVDTLTITNKRVYIRLSGYVWEDKMFAKYTDYNEKWRDPEERDPVDNSQIDVNDQRLANVQVTLRRADGSIIDSKRTSTITNSQGQQEEGAYIFGDYLRDPSAPKVRIEDLDGAYIEFEYNGMCYASVQVNADLDIGSKATDEESRPQFNENYATIVNNESQNGSGQSVYRLNYDVDYSAHTSTLNYGGQYLYGYDGQNYPIAGIDEQYLITANTADATPNVLLGQTKYTMENIYSGSVEEIPNINLGVKERLMPDLAVVEDVNNVDISLNGYSHRYDYHKRDGMDSFNMDVKFGVEDSYGNMSYTREIASSDVSYNASNPDDPQRLQMYLTYKISVRNEADSVYTIANQLVNYYDSNYTIASITDEQGNALNYQVDNGYNENNGYSKVYINTGFQLTPFTQKIVYITYRLNDNAILSVLNEDLTLNSVTEVSSYSSFEDENYSTRYAGVDRDSNPENTDPVNRGTYEDDTDSAPAFIVRAVDGRTISGTVWEDSAIEERLALSGYDKERIGDGILQDNENKVQNVKVELLSVGDDVDLGGANLLNNNFDVATLYRVDESRQPYTEEAVYEATGTNGYYEFNGIIPGRYLIRYTYGNNSVICDTDGNAIETIEAKNYKSTIYRGGDKTAAESMDNFWYRDGQERLSDARDEVGIDVSGNRFDIVTDRTTKSQATEEGEITYRSVTEENSTSRLENIEAATRGFEIEYDYNQDDLSHISDGDSNFRVLFDNVDLGIIRRPLQPLVIDKKVTYIKVTLANGQVIVEGNPETDDLQYVRFLPDGNISIELDNELMQGATLTVRYGITVDNTDAEIDYYYPDYYIYGIQPSDKTNSFKISTVTKLYDYLSNDLVYDENSELNQQYNWQYEEIKQDLVDEGYLSQEAFDVIKNYNQVLQTDYFKNMEPGNSQTAEMEVSRLLSTTADDFSLDNFMEVNRLTGDPIESSTPGNYVPGNSETEESDDDTVLVTITSPTGEDRNYVPYIILGISTLIILGAGVIFIKKKVIK